MTTDIADIEAVRTACGITDHDDDLWLAGVLAAVSEAIETITGRWFAPRAGTYYFDAAADPYTLEVPQGVASITYLGVATSDQPGDGTGTYTEIASGYYLDPPVQERRNGAPATRITLSTTAGAQFPTNGERRAIKATCVLGAYSPRVAQIAVAATVRAFRARSSGGADYTIVGPDGGMKILRDLAPSELEELRNVFGAPMVA